MAEVKKQLVVFDFDWSMADQDTDRWTFEVLAPDIRRDMETREANNDGYWTDIVAECLAKLHARGGTPDQIRQAMRAMPFHPAMVRAVTHLKEKPKPQTTFLCLSNSNTTFIGTILEDKGLQNLFTEIITNPATFTPDGRLDLRRRVPPDGPQHACKVGCQPNMCKGDELDAYLARSPPFDRVVYVGDGSNDYCPVLRMRAQDLTLCRRSRGLSKRIAREGAPKCEVQYWEGAWEVEEVFNAM